MLNKLRQSSFIASLLISSMLFLSIQPVVNAAIVSTADLVAEQQSHIDKDILMKSIERADVQSILVSEGVDLEMAKTRVASMTDEEVKILNGKISELPMGSGDSIIETLGFILVILLFTDAVNLTNIYTFI